MASFWNLCNGLHMHDCSHIYVYIYIYLYTWIFRLHVMGIHVMYMHECVSDSICLYYIYIYIYIKAYTFCRSAGSTLVKGHPYTYVRLHPEEAATPRCGQGCNYHWFSQESIVIDLRNGQGGIWHGVASLAPNRQIYLYLMQGCCTKSHTTAMPYMLAAVF